MQRIREEMHRKKEESMLLAKKEKENDLSINSNTPHHKGFSTYHDHEKHATDRSHLER